MRTVSVTAARATLGRLLDEIEEGHGHVVVTRKDRPAAVLISPIELEALEETLEVIEDDGLHRALEESQRDVRAGRVKPLHEVRRQLGLA